MLFLPTAPTSSMLPRSRVYMIVDSDSVISHLAHPGWVDDWWVKQPPFVQPVHQLLSNPVWVASTPNALALGCTLSGVWMPGIGRICGNTCLGLGPVSALGHIWTRL